MDVEYADWWLPKSSAIYYFKSGGEYFLVRSLGKPMCYKVIACVEEDIAKRYNKMPFGVKFFRSEKKTFYNSKLGMPLHVVCKNDDAEYIPIWKIDAI